MTIGVHARNDVIAALRAEGEKQNRTTSNMAGQALEDWCLARGLIKRDRKSKHGFEVARS